MVLLFLANHDVLENFSRPCRPVCPISPPRGWLHELSASSIQDVTMIAFAICFDLFIIG